MEALAAALTVDYLVKVIFESKEQATQGCQVTSSVLEVASEPAVGGYCIFSTGAVPRVALVNEMAWSAWRPARSSRVAEQHCSRGDGGAPQVATPKSGALFEKLWCGLGSIHGHNYNT